MKAMYSLWMWRRVCRGSNSCSSKDVTLVVQGYDDEAPLCGLSLDLVQFVHITGSVGSQMINVYIYTPYPILPGSVS